MPKRNSIARVSTILIVGLTPLSVHAYLDPGTGSILLQGLIGAVAAALVVGKLYWYRFKAFMARLIGREAPAEVPQASDADGTD